MFSDVFVLRCTIRCISTICRYSADRSERRTVQQKGLHWINVYGNLNLFRYFFTNLLLFLVFTSKILLAVIDFILKHILPILQFGYQFFKGLQRAFLCMLTMWMPPPFYPQKYLVVMQINPEIVGWV